MAGMNKVTLIGNIGNDPDIYNTQAGKKIAKFSLATSDGMKDQNGEAKTEWHKIVCFGGTAELAEKYIKKGDMIAVDGSISYGKYDKDTGETVYTTEILCNRVVFVGGKKHETHETHESEARLQKFDVSGDITAEQLPF